MDIKASIKEELSHNIDWQYIKQIICDVVKSLEVVCQMLPPGMIKSIVCGVVSVLSVICAHLPALPFLAEKK